MIEDTDLVAVFRPLPSVGLGRTWHVLERELHGFMLVAPLPCGFVQAAIQSEQYAVARATLTIGEVAVLERRICRHCLTAVRAKVAA